MNLEHLEATLRSLFAEVDKELYLELSTDLPGDPDKFPDITKQFIHYWGYHKDD